MFKQKIDKVDKKILKKMKIKATRKNLDELEGDELDRFNYFKTKEVGNKKYDYLRLLDSPSKKTFKQNLYDWDKANWKFQKKHGTHVSNEFDNLWMIGEWFQAIPLNSNNKHQNEILYGTLESARSHVFIAVLDALGDKLDDKYPMIFKTHYGEKLFKKTKNKKYSKMIDLESRYGLNEKEHTLIKNKLRSITDEIEQNVIKELEPLSGFTFKESRTEDGAMADTFIIGGFEAAKKIYFKELFKGFYEYEQPYQILKNIEKKLTKKYWKILQQSPKVGDA